MRIAKENDNEIQDSLLATLENDLRKMRGTFCTRQSTHSSPLICTFLATNVIFVQFVWHR